MATKKKPVGTEVLDEVEEKVEEEKEPLTPNQYFDILKGNKQKADLEELKLLYENGCSMMQKYTVTGQIAGAEKLYHFLEVCQKEIKAVKAGADVYITRQDLDKYIKDVASKSVVLIDLPNYEREIPDEVVEKLMKFKEKNIFDGYYVLFTDYTGKERSKVEKVKREKDPILFGIMKIGKQINNRLYYIDSWVDEFCDLTLDKLIKEFKGSVGVDPTKRLDISKYASFEDFKKVFAEETKPKK